MQIYLDYSATTPTHPQVIERVATILQHHWGNPSSLHSWGQDTATVIEMAREQVAGLINANSDQIIFTSGGTAIKLKLISPLVNRPRPVPYTHLTLPTILRVYISMFTLVVLL